MIRPLETQATEFLLAAGLGIVLGILYDWGRAHRRVARKLTVPVDILFALVFFLSLLLTALYTRGLKLYQPLGILLGAGLWFLTLSPGFLRLLMALLLKIRRVGKALKSQAKKSLKFLRKLIKKFFPSSAKWSTIDMIPFLPKGKYTQQKGALPHDQRNPHRRAGNLGRVESGAAFGRPAKGRRPGRRSGSGAG